MTGILKVPELAENDGMTEVYVRRGRIDSELHRQGSALVEQPLQTTLGKHFDRASRQAGGLFYGLGPGCGDGFATFL